MLEVEGLSVVIAGFPILRGVSFRVGDGQVVGLIGPNGAGKTTAGRAVMGLGGARAGGVRRDGVELGPLPPHARARLGIGYMPDDRRLIGNLSVEDNLKLPAWAQGIGNIEARLETVYGLIPELRELRARSAGALSGGQQKLVALGRSFVAGRRLLLLDEPFEGVAPTLARRLLEVIRAFRDRQPGLAVLVCESSFDWVRQVADEVHFIERGETTRAV